MCGETVTKLYETLLATHPPAGSMIRVVLVDGDHGWQAFFLHRIQPFFNLSFIVCQYLFIVICDPRGNTMRSARSAVSFDMCLPRPRTRVVGVFPDGHSAFMLVLIRLRYVAGTRWGTRKHLAMERLAESVMPALVLTRSPVGGGKWHSC
jgi:hypothetical protein